MKIMFAVALIIVIVVIGVFLVPIVNENVGGAISAEGAGWNSEVLAAVRMYPVFFLCAIGIAGFILIWKIRG